MASKKTESGRTLMLAYAGCSTCKKALKWLESRGVDVEVRPIVDRPPSVEELEVWIPKSGRSARKWLNTSGQSYRAFDKARLAAASDDDIARLLAADGKLVKRPVVVTEGRVLVGFDEEAFGETFGSAR